MRRPLSCVRAAASVAMLAGFLLSGCAESSATTNGPAPPSGTESDGTSTAAAAALPTCGTAPTQSNGPLADIATLSAPTVHDSGIGGPPDDPPGYRLYDANVTLSVRASGPSLLMPNAWVTVLQDGASVGLIQARSVTQPELTDEVKVSPGAQTIGSGFQALGCDGNSLPAGRYQVVVTYEYQLLDDANVGSYQLVSPPTAWSFP